MDHATALLRSRIRPIPPVLEDVPLRYLDNALKMRLFDQTSKADDYRSHTIIQIGLMCACRVYAHDRQDQASGPNSSARNQEMGTVASYW